MCWLKAVGGGWTSSIRMHEAVLLPCIFGCLDCRDEYRHYLTCPILWQLAKEALNLMETSFAVGDRLCLTEVNINRVRLLGYCHSLYHHIRSSPECFDGNGNVRDSRFVQNLLSRLLGRFAPWFLTKLPKFVHTRRTWKICIYIYIYIYIWICN